MRILMVYPEFPDTFWGFKHAIKFIDKKATNPPLGLATVAAMIPADWEKRLVDLNITQLDQKDIDWADYIFISAMEVQRTSVYTVIARCKASNKKIVAGGPLFTAEYQRFPDVDHLILNEGEITIPLFLADLEKGCPQKLYSTPDYADITQTPIPMWELVDVNKYESMSIQYSRGCPFNCDFCNVTALLGHRPRTKTRDQIIAELDRLYELGWRRNIFFVDDNLIGNKKHIKEEILPALIEWRKGKTGCLFITEVSINLADDEELMDLMVKAGFTTVFVGIETPNEESLTECHKTQNRNRNLVESVKHLQRKGLEVMGGFIVGFDNDTTSIFQRQIDFIQQSGIVTAMVGLLQAPYGTRLYARMQSEGRLLDVISGDNADGTTNIIPKMDAEVLKSGYLRLMGQIYSPKLFYQRVKTLMKEHNPNHAAMGLTTGEIKAFFRSIWQLGILGKERWQYWNLFFWTLVHFPAKFPQAITFSIYGYHFRKLSELHMLEYNSARNTQKLPAGKKQWVSGPLA